jgi:2-oxoglutarate ferredoxin oxidoreductase subunit alpha
VAHCHLRYIHPFPKNLGEILRSFDKVLVAELNMGQLNVMLRSQFLIDTQALNKVQGKPFSVAEVLHKIHSLLS